MCLPLSSIGGRTAMNYLITGNPEAEPDVEVKEDESMKDAAYQLIVAIANQGYTDTVMGALAAQEPTAAPFCTPRAPAPRMPEVL